MEAPVMRPRRGYTLIEVMVAVLLLTIALPGLVVFVVGARKTQTTSFRMDQATSYGQLVLDSLALLPATARSAGAQSTSSTIGGVSYTAAWQIPAIQGGSFIFPVAVRWIQGGKTHQISLIGVLR